MMTYYNKTTNKHYRGGAFHTADGTIFNPSEETLAKYGYEPYTPPPPPPPQPMTDEELAEERRRAYEVECDRYTMAYQGYMFEGKIAEAEACKQAYLAKKREIRARIGGAAEMAVQHEEPAVLDPDDEPI